jgi:galactokinase
VTETAAEGFADQLDLDSEVRLTGFVYARAYQSAPAGAWRAPAGVVLLGGPGAALTAALPWGVIVAAAPLPDRVLECYSMNHHTEGFRTPLSALDAAPSWAAPCVLAMITAGRPGGLRVVINRELPAETGLLTGAEISCAVSLALRDLYGVSAKEDGGDPLSVLAWQARARKILLTGDDGVSHLPWDLATAGLRLVIIEVGAEGPPDAPAGGDVARAAGLLKTGGLAGFGSLLTAAHVRGERVLDLALDAAVAGGALGGRAIGRCAVVLAPLAAVPAIRSSVGGALNGVARRPPRFLTVGARRP